MYLWQVGQFAKWWDIPQAFWGEREWQSESITIHAEFAVMLTGFGDFLNCSKVTIWIIITLLS